VPSSNNDDEDFEFILVDTEYDDEGFNNYSGMHGDGGYSGGGGSTAMTGARLLSRVFGFG
jgi:hypothetical protein